MTPRTDASLGGPCRWYIGGRVASDFGERALVVILPFAAIDLGYGPDGVSVLLIASQGSLLLGLLFVGAFGVPVPKRALLVTTDLVRAATQTTVFVLFAAGSASLWLLAVLQLVAGLLSSLSIPVAEAAVADLAPVRSRQRANGLLGSGRSVVRIAAPAMAGALAVVAGVDVMFLVSAVAFLVGAAAVATVRFPPGGALPAPGRVALRAVGSRRWLVVSSLAAAATNALAVAPVLVLGPVVMDTLSGGPAGWGVLMTAFGIGATCGGLILLRRRLRRPLRTAFLVSPVLAAFPLSLAVGLPLAGLCVAAFLAGFQATVVNAAGETSRQSHLEPELRVQGSAFASLLAFGLTPVGLALAGVTGTVAGPSTVLLVAGVLAVLVPLTALGSAEVRQMTLPDDGPDPGPGAPDDGTPHLAPAPRTSNER